MRPSSVASEGTAIPIGVEWCPPELSPIDNPRSFFEAARAQLVCAFCHRPVKEWEAHHVLEKRHCRWYGAPRHSPDDALRLCAKHPASCHSRHTTHQELVPLACLRDENIAFIARWLGLGPGYEYLVRHYAGSDPRVDHLLRDAG